MRAVVQRVAKGNVKVEEETTGAINKGLLVFLGVAEEDEEQDVKYLADKIVNLRIFEDEQEKMNLSLCDIAGELLVISQFTLYGDCRKGRRPNFTKAAKPEKAQKLYERFVSYVQEQYNIETGTGVFGEYMEVSAENDGPVTLLLDSKRSF